MWISVTLRMPKLYFDSRRYADLPLHYGKVPPWLAERMRSLGGAIVEAIVQEYGKSAVLSRLSDPFWFQAFGCRNGLAFVGNHNFGDGSFERSSKLSFK
jgi:hypothetical protein